jgi:hypothetical protein
MWAGASPGHGDLADRRESAKTLNATASEETSLVAGQCSRRAAHRRSHPRVFSG